MTFEELKTAFVNRTHDAMFSGIANEWLLHNRSYNMPRDPHYRVWLGYEIATMSKYLLETTNI